MTVNLAEIAPSGTVTLAGTLAAAWLLESITTAPPAGAGPLNVSVACEVWPPITSVGFSSSEARVGRVGGPPPPSFAQYIPPVFVFTPSGSIVPPHMIICEPVHTACCKSRALGALCRVVLVQELVAGLYRPPVLVETNGQVVFTMPPQTISSLPVHTDGKSQRAAGADVSAIGLQLFVPGL